jgi:hypothetical protein
MNKAGKSTNEKDVRMREEGEDRAEQDEKRKQRKNAIRFP